MNPTVKIISLFLLLVGCSQIEQIPVSDGWSKNSINTVVFRKNSLFSFDNTQYIAFYDSSAIMVLGKRKLQSENWQLTQTRYTGNALDAHNSISIIVDGDGYIHVSWDHHNTPLRYAKSKKPFSLELDDETQMIGSEEKVVSYPEFFQLPNGDLIFLYRNGGSGNGDLVINRYSTKTQSWQRLVSNLISGENERNAYWQTAVDKFGTIHISWVWRESPDVASNHDMCYAKSTDGGVTWVNSRGSLYELPITAKSAEYVAKIPQNSELINQTSMTTDSDGHPYIATYFKPKNSDIPQYHIIYQDDQKWESVSTKFRTEPFSLSGSGTKAIPISRPQLIATNSQLYLIFRDAERGNRISVASSNLSTLDNWNVNDLTTDGYSFWEPTYDPSAWSDKGDLHLFVQDVSQIDKEGLANQVATPISVLKWKPD